MGQCNAQTNSSTSVVQKVTINQSAARSKTEPPYQQKLRGLELIKTCKKFYENGVLAAKPNVQLASLNRPATRQKARAAPFRHRAGTIAVMCSSFLVLPGLALATIVWWSTTNWDGGVAAANDQSAVSAGLGPAGATRNHLHAAAAVQNTRDAASAIIIHKVKTERIPGVTR